VGRTQELLCVLADLIDQGRLSPPRIFIDSPMAIRATDVTLRHIALIDPRAAALLRRLLEGPRSPVQFVHTPSESRSLADIPHGALIISASGMCEGGRILHHLKQNLPRPECGVIFAGFQALGTRGRRIVDGARSVTIHGESVPVRAQVFTIGGLSAHADQPALLDWLANFREPPRHTFLVHGEQPVSEAFGEAIRERFGWEVAIPARGSSVIV
jgi:metallo-beta-lactamase family protein